MDKRQIGRVFEMSKNETSYAINIKHLQKTEEKLEKVFQQPFSSYERKVESDRALILFFEIGGDLIQFVYFIFANGEESSDASFVRIKNGRFDSSPFPAVPKIQGKEKNEKLREIGKVFLKALREENQFRLLALTGLIQLDEKNIQCDIYQTK